MNDFRLILYFIPKSHFDEPALLRRSKLFVQLTLFIACAAAMFAGVYFMLGFTGGSIGLLTALTAAVINLLIYKTSGAITFAANIILLMMFSVLTYLTYNIGGLQASSLPWLITIPLLSLLILDRFWVWIWAVLVELNILTLFIIERTGPEFITQQLTEYGTRFTHFSGTSGLVLVILGISVMSHKLTSETLDESRIKAEKVAEHLKNVFEKVNSGTEILFNASAGLSSISKQISSSVEQTFEQTETASAGAISMLDNMNEVTEIMDESSVSLEGVAMNAEQMTATINEISKNTETARRVTANAVSEAEGSSEEIARLGNAAEDIGKVTETISDISEQTNLLALNATIEAARAGEAGRGFAVVASEIKELARQTTEAASEIKQRIDGIQNSTHNTVKRIAHISGVITSVSETVNIISAAVEEQSVTTSEIAGNLRVTSDGINNVNTKISDCSSATRDITDNFLDVKQKANEMQDSSGHLNKSAEDHLVLAEELKDKLVQYKG